MGQVEKSLLDPLIVKVIDCEYYRERKILIWLRTNINQKSYWVDRFPYTSYTHNNTTLIMGFYYRSDAIRFKLMGL
jgi:hypothetical protein